MDYLKKQHPMDGTKRVSYMGCFLRKILNMSKKLCQGVILKENHVKKLYNFFGANSLLFYSKVL